jgi:hypothetical protein
VLPVPDPAVGFLLQVLDTLAHAVADQLAEVIAAALVAVIVGWWRGDEAGPAAGSTLP